MVAFEINLQSKSNIRGCSVFPNNMQATGHLSHLLQPRWFEHGTAPALLLRAILFEGTSAMDHIKVRICTRQHIR